MSGVIANETRRLKYAATINDESLPDGTKPDYELQYIDIGNVDSNGSVRDIATYKFEDAPSRARRIAKHGDVIVSTVRTYLQAIAPIENPPNNLVVSTGFAVVRPKGTFFDEHFCKYALRENHFLWEVQSRSSGVSYPAINASDLANIKVSLPDLKTQRVIANYLDRETARIDALVAARRKMLDLLEEKRTALISRAVTEGLTPDVPIKPSGLEWLGDIPVHWRTERAKNIFSVRDQRSEAGNEELLTVSHITGVTRRSEKDVYMFQADDKTGYKRCYPNDLVINTLWGWMGAMGISPHEGIVSPDYHVYISNGLLLPEFIELLCRSKPFIAEVSRWSKGVWSSRLRLYPENFFEMRLPIPPHQEQREIIATVGRNLSKTDEFAGLMKQSIFLAKERRAALISTAVTGQIPVKEMQK
ncbi:restriction endonuclease subunit S [Marinobacter salarius]|jgi:type I restriction enzyme S subunit|uniref:restriction endonuclease subunit S n=1 Tax=Marinobacter salarius TaxID=1420917 RepID=UPI0018F117A9|nr:restriction endonuclease subunit S [Marinobacter salarius]MBJ7300552.1 restriction endonuclease subunit S [Marinobacter salarius]HIO30263.1 restriction endonuclease subunit S [Marinobacter salarius]HIO98729.1 restriction endonuclease subunit S [Marinobacter salarius]